MNQHLLQPSATLQTSRRLKLSMSAWPKTKPLHFSVNCVIIFPLQTSKSILKWKQCFETVKMFQFENNRMKKLSFFFFFFKILFFWPKSFAKVDPEGFIFLESVRFHEFVLSREPLPAKGHAFREPPPNIPLIAALLPSGCFYVFTLLMKPHRALFFSLSIIHTRQPIARHLLSCDHFSHKKRRAYLLFC